MIENVNGSPPEKNCFVLFYSLNLLVDVLLIRCTQKSPENENLRPIKNAYEILRSTKIFQDTFFQVPFYTHIAARLGLHESNDTINVIVL